MIIPIDSRFRQKVNEIIAEEWAGPMVAARGKVRDTSNSDGFISVTDGELTGYILYIIENGECEILVLHSLLENQGIGAGLVEAVVDAAKSEKCRRVWLITTNDNIHAIRYYQKHGFELEAVHINALDKSRELKPSIPLFGSEGIPIKHEFEFGIEL